MPVRAVFFDLGNTLVSYYRKEEFLPVLAQSMERCLSVLSAHGYNYDFATLLPRAIAQDPGRTDHQVTPITQRLTAIFPDPAIQALLPDLTRAFMEPVFATARVIDGAFELLQSLHDRQLPLVLVSNTPWGSPAALWRSHLQDIGIAPYFGDLVFCVDTGWRKPHPAIFHHALARAGLSATDVLFVGDDPAWDVAGAQSVGMPVIVVNQGTYAVPPGIPVVASLEDVLEYC